ncbi:hypothetical protein ES703_101603 [subsurface metagenome]
MVIPHPADIAEAMRRGEMATQTDELKKLITIASDLKLAAELRTKAIELVGNIGTHDALLALLEIAANEKLVPKERDLALKYAREVIKAGR